MLIVCFLLFSLFSSPTALEEGDDCTTNEKHGSCKLIQDCIYAQNLLKNQQNPDICGFEGLDAIVCCPVSEKSATPTKNALLMSRPQKVQHKTLSEIKCEQFYPTPLFPIHVTGGLKSLAKEFPHMAIIGFGNETNKQWQCGGSLITKRFVLTAAHCLDSIELLW